MASDEGKSIILKSSDGEEFVVEEAVALLSQAIRNTIEVECTESRIPLPNVNIKILAKVIDYCKKHVECTPVAASTSEGKAVDEELRSWDSDFVKVDQATLFDLTLAANYLDILIRATILATAAAVIIIACFNVKEQFNLDARKRKKQNQLLLKDFHQSELLGRGLYARVYRAIFSESNTIYTVKRFNRHVSSKTSFQIEVTAIHRLRHQNILELKVWCNVNLKETQACGSTNPPAHCKFSSPLVVASLAGIHAFSGIDQKSGEQSSRLMLEVA